MSQCAVPSAQSVALAHHNGITAAARNLTIPPRTLRRWDGHLWSCDAGEMAGGALVKGLWGRRRNVWLVDPRLA